MAIGFYRAVITAENYQSFRRILNDAPETFDKWSHENSKDLAYIEGTGGNIVYVDVEPEEFTAFCRETDSPANLQSLKNFAFEKGTREEK